jgi:hypothetical protein
MELNASDQSFTSAEIPIDMNPSRPGQPSTISVRPELGNK